MYIHIRPLNNNGDNQQKDNEDTQQMESTSVLIPIVSNTYLSQPSMEHYGSMLKTSIRKQTPSGFGFTFDGKCGNNAWYEVSQGSGRSKVIILYFDIPNAAYLKNVYLNFCWRCLYDIGKLKDLINRNDVFDYGENNITPPVY